MSLTTGTRLGPYEILGTLGAGGMGEVYRATDTKLKRQVAIKILPPSLAADRDRLARFQREAEVLASLNHLNIAAIFGLEESGGAIALVMELVEGEDLSQRLARGAIPLDEALPIARQIAEALEAAHEQNIIHRDLKPANIKVRPDGTVKVLDFGLAKALDPAGASSASAGALANSPTLTSPAMTAMGMILGTAAYMSPEQARGRPVDKRADIWAFGVVLYEMLTGAHLFAGESIPETLGLIFSREPDLAALPAATPARVRALIARCLVRDSRQRLRDIGDARLEIDGVGESNGKAPAVPTRSLWRALPWGLVLATALVAGWALWGRSRADTTTHDTMYFDIGFPPDVEPLVGQTSPIAIAPDGRSVAMIGVKDSARRLFLRRLDRGDTIEVPGTSGVDGVVFSPDGADIVFVPGSGALTRLSLVNGQRKVLGPSAGLTGGLAWTQAGIVFVRDGALWIVSAQGGTPRALTVLDAARHEVLHDRPLLLPGGRFVLFSSVTSEPGAERIEAVSIDGGRRSVVVERAMTPIWSPTGHLVFSRDGAVLAVPLDPDTATVRGTAVPVMAAGAVQNVGAGFLGLWMSSTGTLVYLPDGFGSSRLASVARDGSTLALDLPSGAYQNPRIAPDGRRLMVESESDVIEVLDLARGTRARLTPPAFGTIFSTWNSDGTRVVFKRFTLPFWISADGSTDPVPLPAASVNDFPSSAGPDPDSVLVVRVRPESSGDVFLMSLSGAFEPKPLIVTPAYEGGPHLSPDHRWLLYQSNVSGQAEIYVRRYPALDQQWQVSAGGGAQARWSRSGKEIYYRSEKDMMAVAIDDSGAEPAFGKPLALFADEYDFGLGISIANYDVTPDGRFIMLRRGANGGKLRVVVNWTEELERILARGGVR
jgi:eukaryotic-like serine/threonine-protein kinase